MKAPFVTVALAVIGLTMAAVGASALPASATQIVDFACSSSLSSIPCTTAAISGTVTRSGTNFSSTGIAIWNDVQYSLASPFQLSFNTATDSIDIFGTGAWAGQNFTGTFTSFTSSVGKFQTTLTFNNVSWTLSSAATAKLGGGFAFDAGSVSFPNPSAKGSKATSVDIGLTVVPEPSTLALFGPGMLGLGGMVLLLQRRRIRPA